MRGERLEDLLFFPSALWAISYPGTWSAGCDRLGWEGRGATEGDLLLCLWATVWSQGWEGQDCWASVCRNKFVEFDMKPVCKRCYERFPLELKKRLKKLSDMTSRKAQPKSVDVNSV